MANIELIKGADNGNPSDKLSQAYPKINRSMTNINNQVVNQESRLVTTEAAVTDHGSRINETETELVNQDERITNIVASAGDSNTEIVDARQPAAGPAFPILRDRLNAVDAQLAETAAKLGKKVSITEYEYLIPNKNVAASPDDWDWTEAFQQAVQDYRYIICPLGKYIVGPVDVPAARRFIGEGNDHYKDENSTLFVTRDINQEYMLKHEEGADSIVYKSIKIRGVNGAKIGIDGTHGAFAKVNDVGIYGFSEYGLYSEQGLLRVDGCFFENEGVGLHLFSDSTVSNTEFTGGTIPLYLSAGGNQLSSVWSNSASEACIKLKPLTATTNHINTNMSNVYVGEMPGATSVTGVIVSEPNGSSKVRDVKMNNVHIVIASVSQIAGGILATEAENWTISNSTVLGFGSFSTANKIADFFLFLTDCREFTVSNCTIKGVNRHPIQLAGCETMSFSNIILRDYGGPQATAPDHRCGIYMTNCTKIMIDQITFSLTNGDENCIAIRADDGGSTMIGTIYLDYPAAEAVDFAANQPFHRAYRAGEQTASMSGNMFLDGKLSFASDGAANTPVIQFPSGGGVYGFLTGGVALSDGSTIKAYTFGDDFYIAKGNLRVDQPGKGVLYTSPDGNITKVLGIDNNGDPIWY